MIIFAGDGCIAYVNGGEIVADAKRLVEANYDRFRDAMASNSVRRAPAKTRSCSKASSGKKPAKRKAPSKTTKGAKR